MWLAAANVMPSYVTGNRFSGCSTEEALARAKKGLRECVKALYAAGQGEWDSSTYLMFDLHGMLNIYDFAKDAETRLLAQAALDWYVAGYALKYRDGVYTAPNQRGFAGTPVATKKGSVCRIIKIAGKKTGFVVHVGNADELAKIKVGDDGFTGPDGRNLKMKFIPAEGDDAHGNRLADVSIDGKPVSAGAWPIYGGPFVTQTPGVLTVSDGAEGYIVDFTGDLPVYRSK